jgi:hypothetical protein
MDKICHMPGVFFSHAIEANDFSVAHKHSGSGTAAKIAYHFSIHIPAPPGAILNNTSKEVSPFFFNFPDRRNRYIPAWGRIQR